MSTQVEYITVEQLEKIFREPNGKVSDVPRKGTGVCLPCSIVWELGARFQQHDVIDFIAIRPASTFFFPKKVILDFSWQSCDTHTQPGHQISTLFF